MKTTDEREFQKTTKERLRKTERSKGNRTQWKGESWINDTWNECIKKSDGMVNWFFYSEFNVRMPII